MRQARYRYFLLPLFLVLACAGLWAQANSELTGIVTDQTGAVVAGAKVTLTDPGTGVAHSTVTGGTGLYDISGLNPGNYNLQVSAKGFEAFVENGIVVNVSATVREDVKLTVGVETQTVTVEADALAVQTDSNVVSTLISSEQISEIATENRNFAALAALGLGVSSRLPDSNTPGSVGSNFSISVNGLRQNHNIWLIDGGESDDRGGAGGMQIQPSQDAIAEFVTMGSNYPPDYGISSGATFSLSLKAGTQKFHGSLWEENRNTDYDANGYFNKQANNPRPAVHYNIYGFNIGGPLFVPKMYNVNKQKTFFFWNEEWRKTVNLVSSNNATVDPADVPTSLTTDLKYVSPLGQGVNLVVPNVPLTSDYYLNHLKPLGLTPGQAFPNNTIPHTLFDSNFYTYLTAGVLPKPNLAGQDRTISAASLPFKVRDDVVRIDHKFSDKWAILGHYIGDTEMQGFAQPELGWCWCGLNTLGSSLSSPSHSAAIKLSGTINPNLLVEASINYDGNQIDITPSANSYKPASWSVQPLVSAYTITRKVFPGMSFNQPYWIGEDTATEPYHNAAQDYEPKVDVSYTVSRHAMKYGFSYNRYTKNQMLYGDEQGNYGTGGKSNDSIMDALLGLTTSYSQAQSAPIRHYVNQTPSVYVQDNWHVTPRLSLQLGLRWDGLPHAWERNNYIGNFVESMYNPNEPPVWVNTSSAIDPSSPDLYTFNGIPSYINGTGLAGKNHFPRGAVNNDYRTLQPRVGFSQDLFGNGKTVLRGGFGTFFERIQGNDIYGVATSPPFDPQASVGNPYFSNPGKAWDTGAQLTPNNLIFAGSPTTMALNYRAPATAQFSLGVQHELSPSVVWVVQYIGNLEWHQSIDRQINNSDPASPAVTPQMRCIFGDSNNNYPGDTTCNVTLTNLGGGGAFRKYPGYNGITQQENTTNGNYSGFQTGVRMQNRWGLSGEIDYTWSHGIDIKSGDISGISNPWYIKYDKGSGDYDRRQMLSANYIYKLPFLNGTGLLHSIAGGWEIAGTIIDETGIPYAPSESLNYDPVGLQGGYTVRPNETGKTTYPKKVGEWFNTAQFTKPVPFWLGGPNEGFGNSGKDAIVGPGRVNFTTSLYKSFAITERARFELRFESFNTFNHTELNDVSTGLGSGNYGQITDTWDPRALELGGKFIF